MLGRCLLALLAMLLASGCAGSLATNRPLERVDLTRGYRPELVDSRHAIGEVGLLLSFSGGGTRAAALAYGVMQELRATPTPRLRTSESLLDNIDVISSVSGGSFTAAYYGLYGDRLFEDFEERFLRLNVQRGISLRLLLPQNWIRLLRPSYDRTSIAIDYYNKKIFDGATYQDMIEANGPMIEVNSTNISAGTRFSFIQPHFDLICSDLSQLWVAEAVTASSAVPVVFPSIVLENFAGDCGYQTPPWITKGLTEQRANPRRYNIAFKMNEYTDADQHPYLHLVDGGIADNLGVRGPLDAITVGGGIWDRLQQLNTKPPKYLAFIVVNAATEPNRPFRRSPMTPPLGELISSVTDTQLHRYNEDTMNLLRLSMTEWAASLSQHDYKVDAHLIEISASGISDPEDREFFNNVPTSLTLDDDSIARLIQIGRKLVRESPEFQALVAELN